MQKNAKETSNGQVVATDLVHEARKPSRSLLLVPGDSCQIRSRILLDKDAQVSILPRKAVSKHHQDGDREETRKLEKHVLRGAGCNRAVP